MEWAQTRDPLSGYRPDMVWDLARLFIFLVCWGPSGSSFSGRFVLSPSSTTSLLPQHWLKTWCHRTNVRGQREWLHDSFIAPGTLGGWLLEEHRDSEHDGCGASIWVTWNNWKGDPQRGSGLNPFYPVNPLSLLSPIFLWELTPQALRERDSLAGELVGITGEMAAYFSLGGSVTEAAPAAVVMWARGSYKSVSIGWAVFFPWACHRTAWWDRV